MKKMCHQNEKPLWLFIHFLVLMLCWGQVVDVLAQPPKKMAGANRAGVYSDVPYGYNQVGSTHLYARFSQSIDFIGLFEGRYYSSTYSDAGYYPALQVNDGNAQWVNCSEGSNIDGVEFTAIVEEQAELARVSYQLTNTNDYDVTISMGIHADVQIGNNDWAPIYRRLDTFGMTYGLTMMDGNGAQLCVLFGSGLAGVTSIDDFWFDRYYTNGSAYETVGNYNPGSYSMQEGGGYDSGMGWCWKNRLIPAGATISFSFLIGVGEVNLEPNSSFAVTPDDPDGWNDLTLPHRLTVNGSYESPAGLQGMIEYAAEDSEDWLPLTEMLNSGDEFTESLTVMFDVNNYDRHRIKFRTRDNVGNTTMLQPIEYIDVRPYSLYGIEESKVYTGDSIFQDHLTCELEDGQWTAVYHNNTNVGRATVNLEGVFPYTIGRKSYFFDITPKPLEGGISLEQDEFVFNREYQYPDWHFTNEAFNELEEEKDYDLVWENNFLPGTASLKVTGKGNYTGTLIASFTINKAELTDDLYTITLPEEEINYDGEAHGAEIYVESYVGEPTFTYVSRDGAYNSTAMPTEGGEYDIYLEIAEGEGYLALSRVLVGSFTIYQISDEVWTALQNINNQLGQSGNAPWDLSEGVKSVSSQPGITVEQGRITQIDLSSKDIVGAIPDELFCLPDLESLDLSGNLFTNSFDEAWVTAMTGNTSTNLHYIDISNNGLSGNLGAFASAFTSLQTLLSHNNAFSEIQPMVSPAVTRFTYYGQQIEEPITMTLAELVNPTFSDKVPTAITYNHNLQSYDADINMVLGNNNESDYWSVMVRRENGNVTITENNANSVYNGENGALLYLSKVTGNEPSTVPVILSFDMGDVNFSGNTNVMDLQAMVNFIFNDYNNPFNYTAANIWSDQTINVQDVIGIVNVLMDMNLPTQMANHAPSQTDVNKTEASVFCDGSTLYISSERPVASFDIFVNGSSLNEVSKALQASGMTFATRQTENGMHIIGYSLNGTVLPEGTTAIASLTGTGMVAHAMLSDKEAREIPAMLNNDITGVNSLTADVDVIADAEGLLLCTKKNLPHIAWSIYEMGGMLIDKGMMDDVKAGCHILYPRHRHHNQTWIVKVSTDGEKDIIKKINIK